MSFYRSDGIADDEILVRGTNYRDLLAVYCSRPVGRNGHVFRESDEHISFRRDWESDFWKWPWSLNNYRHRCRWVP